jgi:hypothetical protein
MPPLIKHKGLASATDPGTVGGKPAPWTRLVLQKLVRYPPLAKEMMVLLRNCLDKHQQWRVEQQQIGDSHYIADPRSDEATQKEKALQERILEIRKRAHVMPPHFGKRSHKHILSTTHSGAGSPMASVVAPSVAFVHDGARPSQGDAHAALTEALSIHAGTAMESRPATQGTGVDEDSSEEDEAPGKGAIFQAYPPAVRFGPVPAGCVYRYKVTLLNAGVDYSKYRIRQPKLSNVSVVYTPCQVG